VVIVVGSEADPGGFVVAASSSYSFSVSLAVMADGSLSLDRWSFRSG